jgi:hypothetical protein
MSDPQLHPRVIFRDHVADLPSPTDTSIQTGTVAQMLLEDTLAVLRNVAGVRGWTLYGAGSGSTILMQFAVTTAAVNESAGLVPAGSVVLYRSVEIVTPFTGGTTIELGNSAAPDLLLENADVTPDVALDYSAEDPVPWGGTARKARATVGGGPVAGAGIATLVFGTPIN